MAHNTDQICGCPFNCVWTDFSKYLVGCICIFGIGVIILAMKSNILVLEKWIEYENPSKTDGIQQNEMVPCDSNDWNSYKVIHVYYYLDLSLPETRTYNNSYWNNQ